MGRREVDGAVGQAIRVDTSVVGCAGNWRRVKNCNGDGNNLNSRYLITYRAEIPGGINSAYKLHPDRDSYWTATNLPRLLRIMLTVEIRSTDAPL